MANAKKIAEIEAEFLIAFGRGLQEGGAELWARIFIDVPNEVMDRAAIWLLQSREKSGMVVPGEMAAAVRAVGGQLKAYSTTPEFDAMPVVRAIRRHDDAGLGEAEVSMAEWLQGDGLPSFAAAMMKCAEGPTQADRLYALAGLPMSGQVKALRPGMESKRKEAT